MEGLTRSTALSPAFEGGDEKRRSGSTLSKLRHLCRGVEGLTFLGGSINLEVVLKGAEDKGEKDTL
jgi:hypothetical protein